ncbi:MAG: phytanoyl-CoA dioxygenase family protein [Vicinamibacterales bacterium]
MKDSVAAGVTPLQSLGVTLDDSPTAFGDLRDSTPVAGDVDLLRRRLEQDGYLWIRGLLDPAEVLDARRQVVEWLAAEGLIEADRPIMDAVAVSHAATGFTPEERRFPAVRRLLHTGRLIDVFTRLLGGEVRALDYIWMRLMCPGQATGPHCDIVYMSRGTARLYTSWVPLGDVPRQCGPLMLLEGSHRSDRLRSGYARMDIDKGRNWTKLRFRHGRCFRGGDYSRNPRAVQREFGSRWLTADFAGGDVVIMSVFLMHGSLDNVSDRIRVSADARYQLASDPVDERWIGERPTGHAKR